MSEENGLYRSEMESDLEPDDSSVMDLQLVYCVCEGIK